MLCIREKSKKRSASKASWMAVRGGERAEESFHLPSPPLSCFTSFFFLFPPLWSLVPGDGRMLITNTEIKDYLLKCIMLNLKGSSIFWSIVFRFFFRRFQRNHSLMKKGIFCKTNSLIHNTTSFIVKSVLGGCSWEKVAPFYNWPFLRLCKRLGWTALRDYWIELSWIVLFWGSCHFFY